jgi:hypothetical protein
MSIESLVGQITRGSVAGDFIYNLAQNHDNKIFVDIGFWNGKGSTQCIMDALIERLDECVVYALETDKEFYDGAVKYWDDRLCMYNSIVKSKLKLIHGRVIEPEAAPSLAEVMKSCHSHDRWPQFYREFFDAVEAGCPNVLSDIPAQIDVLILDGGEFTTHAEYELFKDRSRILVCDDSSKYKCEKIRLQLLDDKDYKVLIDAPDQRNGFCAFEYIGERA